MVLIGMLLATGTLKAQQDVFRIAFLTNLGFTTVPGAFCDYKINNAGQVIGTIGTVDQQAAIWANGSITKMLGYYPGAKNGVKYSDGIAINDSGLVAGQCNDINNNVFAMVNNTSGNSGWASLLYPQGGYQFTSPCAINGSGKVVGQAFTSSDATPYPQAFYSYRNDGNTYPIILGGVANGIAYDINDNNIIVGSALINSGVPVAIYWAANSNGGYSGPYALAGANSSAQAVNNGNAIVGYNGNYAVFFYNNSSYELTNGVANAININDFVVGNNAQTYTWINSRAWLYSPLDGTVRDLTSLQASPGLVLYTASDINSNLQIVGQCGNGGYIATPVFYATNSGSWNSASTWNWNVQPSQLNPVKITNSSSAELVVSGPTNSTQIAELSVGGSADPGVTGLFLLSGQFLTVTSNSWGNGMTTVSPTAFILDDGQITSPVQVQGILAGDGVINGSVAVQSTGSILLGNNFGAMSINGDLTFSAGATLSINITNSISSSLLNDDGHVTCGNAYLSVSGASPVIAGQTFIIVHNQSTNVIIGTFTNLPEGAVVTNDLLGSGLSGVISYIGGAGNDIVITAVASTNAFLSGLTLSAGTLSPQFQSNVFNYSAVLTNTNTSFFVTPMAAESNAAITVDGILVTDGAASGNIPLAIGTNEISILVTAQDGVTTDLYSVIVTQLPPAMPPVLGALTNYAVNPGMTINFQAMATSSNPNAVLAFSLFNPPTNAIISTGGVFQWRARLAQANTTNTVTVVVSDMSGSNLSSSNSFTVVVNPLAAVFLNSASGSNGVFSFTVNGFPGPDYITQVSTNIPTNGVINWFSLATNYSPAVPFLFTDTNVSPIGSRLYRVMLLP